MRPFEPNDTELEVLRGIFDGRIVDLTSRQPRPEINGELLRRLLLRHPITGFDPADAMPLPGIRIRGCRIRGLVDLADFAQPGDGLSALVLDDCEFTDTLDLTGARIARLSLRGSRFSHLILRAAEIDGPFDFSFAGPPHEGGDAWIDARDALFRGQVSGEVARLRVPRRPKSEQTAGHRHYALWLRNVDIRGSLALHGLVADGGVSIGASHIRGEVQLRGAVLTAVEDDALNAQNARVGGSLVADEGFSSHGTIWLLGARFGNRVQLSGARLLAGSAENGLVEGAGSALILQNATIGTNLDLDMAMVAGDIQLAGATLGGDLHASGLILGRVAPVADNPVLDAQGTRIAGRVMLDDAYAVGGIDFEGADIRGGFEAPRAALINRHPTRGDLKALSLAGANIGKGVNLGGPVTSAAGPGSPRLTIHCEAEPASVRANNATAKHTLEIQVTLARAQRIVMSHRVDLHRRAASLDPIGTIIAGQEQELSFLALGAVDLTGATLHGDLIAEACLLDNLALDGKGTCLAAERVQIRGNLSLGPIFAAVGRVNLAAAEVGRDLVVRNSDFFNPANSTQSDDAAIFAKDLKAGSNCRLEATVVFGNVVMERLELTGSLSWGAMPPRSEPLVISADENTDRTGVLDLGLAEIGTALKPLHLILHNDVRVNLGGARTALLQFKWPLGWGGLHMVKRRNQFDLDGLHYDRVQELDRDAIHNGAGQWLWNDARWRYAPGTHETIESRRRWQLPAKYSAQWEFSPQPYRQLARVLRTQGDEAGARRISMLERWRSSQPWLLQPIWFLYGRFFGFGLSPLAALMTLLAWVAIGTAFVWAANTAGVLKEAMVVSSTVVSEDKHGTLNVIPFITAGSQGGASVPSQQIRLLHEIPCVDTALNIGDDIVFALDMMLPFIPLHQESRCEISSGHEMPGVQGTASVIQVSDPPAMVDGWLPEWAAREAKALPIWVWRTARAVYTVLGWIIVSIALITFAGVVKRTETNEAE